MSVRNIVPSYIIWNNWISVLDNSLKSLIQRMRRSNCLIRNIYYFSPPGGLGSGAGKGGGAGGSVRESGGGLGQYGTAQEEQFFFNKQREQLEKIKKKLKDTKLGDLTQKADK